MTTARTYSSTATRFPPASPSSSPGQRVEFGVVQGRKGSQALQLRVLDPVPSVARASRRPAEDMAPLVEDLIKVLDHVSNSLRRGRYPEKAEAPEDRRDAAVFADDLDA